MRIIISPAKKMNVDTDSMAYQDLPMFLDRTERLLEKLRSMSAEELKKLWKCSDSIAALNVDRLNNMDLRKALTPAVLAYEGIQYQYMGPGVFSDEEFCYVQEHLRILSGFYGILRPMDGVTPYRLEMQAKLSVDGAKDLYDFWGASLAENLSAETDCIINLASKEYSRAVSKYLPPSVAMITCVFGEEKNGKIVEKGTLCKMARGEMVRYMAEHQVEKAEDIRSFSGRHYRYAPEHSNKENYVFLRKKAEISLDFDKNGR